jgi:hypothetical protein
MMFANVKVLFLLFTALALKLAGFQAYGQRSPTDLLTETTAISLAATCLEVDNDSRRGVEAEQECEQYLRGFLDALGALASSGAGANIPALCLPDNIDALDAVRRAYTRWVFEHFQQLEIPAGDALLQVFEESFSCS